MNTYNLNINFNTPTGTTIIINGVYYFITQTSGGSYTITTVKI